LLVASVPVLRLNSSASRTVMGEGDSTMEIVAAMVGHTLKAKCDFTKNRKRSANKTSSCDIQLFLIFIQH
jgi:hypothetical protein